MLGALVWAFFAVVAVVAVAVGAAAAAGADRKKLLNLANAAIQEIGGLSDFHADFIRVTIEDQRGLAIDESRGLLMLIRGSQRKVVRFDQIISCEIREDNASLITTRRGVGGIVVGGLLGGEVGAIVGGIASPQYSTMTAGARSITLLVVTDELSNPNHVVTFLFGIGGAVVSKNSDAYRSGLANAQLWHSRITVAMRRAEEARSFARQPSISGQLSNSTAIQPLTTAMAPTVAIAPPTQQQPSNRVGERYEVVKQIGGGGMKKVFLAKDSRLGNRQCALAEMIDNLLTPDERKRAITAFQRECDLLATLDDPHIPKIYDHFSEQERHYLVMEYVQGKTLEQVSAENGASIDEDVVVLIALEVLATVSYLHNLNPPVLYRDLKPSNIMLTRDGGVKLIDFGIARHFQPTKTMTMIGTQGYAAPEQYSGKAEVRSDLYGLAAVMHQALSGRDPALYPPFSFPPIATLRPGLNAVLAKCIDHALWYDPTGRPASAAEMRERLLQIPRSTVSNKLIAFAQSRQVTESASADAPTAPAVLDSSDCGMELPPDSSESANCRISTTFQSVTETKPLPPSLPQPSKPVPMSVWFLVGGVTIAAGFVVLSLPAGTPIILALKTPNRPPSPPPLKRRVLQLIRRN